MLAINSINWQKVNGLLPVIIQDVHTMQVLMLGYMNQAALEQTLQSHKVTFYSRSKQRLWQKGETSGHELHVVRILPDCDHDTLLVLVQAKGRTCHLPQQSCFGQDNDQQLALLSTLEMMIAQRKTLPIDQSYIAKLFNQGHYKIAQKVGEEGVEVALASVSGNKQDTIAEAADLVFHLLILLAYSELNFNDVLAELASRAKKQ